MLLAIGLAVGAGVYFTDRVATATVEPTPAPASTPTPFTGTPTNAAEMVAAILSQTPTPTPHGYVRPTRTPSLHADKSTEIFTPECTGSMEPAISCGDKVMLWVPPLLRGKTPFTKDDIEVGTIVSARLPADCISYGWSLDYILGEAEVLHRVVEKEVREISLTYYLLKGDANRHDDGCHINFVNITGVVLEIIKRGTNTP